MKRGPKVGPERYHPRTCKMEMTPEHRDLIERRTLPFLDQFGTSAMPLAAILRDCYLQGMKDALEVCDLRKPEQN